MEVVNVVGGGDLGCELEVDEVIDAVSDRVDEARVTRPSMGLIRFDDEGPSIGLFRTGKFQIRGAQDEKSLFCVKERFIELLDSLGVPVGDPTFDVLNVVFLADTGSPIALEQIISQLGVENVDYEPEQFPGLVYSRSTTGVTLNVFASGKVILLGATERTTVEQAFAEFRHAISAQD